jgi:hypothetical protein
VVVGVLEQMSLQAAQVALVVVVVVMERLVIP